MGVKPVEKPWRRRKNKKPNTVVSQGYIRLQEKQTRDPVMITGLRPILSASFPLKGRDTSAVTVKSDMINPLYSAPPKEDRNCGNSGIIILKLAKKSNELEQRSQNWVV